MTENTTDVLSEIKKCAINFPYFCARYVKILDPVLGSIPFVLRPYHERLFRAFEEDRFVLVPKFRWGGFTTFEAIWALWTCCFSLDKKILVLSKTDRECVYFTGIVRHAIDNFPGWMKPELSKQNDHQIIFEDTGSHIYSHVPIAACGRALTHLLLNEPAFIPDMEDHWRCIYPTISCGGKCFAVSTPNGKKGWFYKTYLDALVAKNSFKVVTVDYKECPDYNKPGWEEEMRRNLGERGWRQEYLCEFLDEKSEADDLDSKVDDLDVEVDDDLGWETDGWDESANSAGSCEREVTPEKPVKTVTPVKASDVVNRRYKENEFHCYDVDGKQVILIGDKDTTSPEEIPEIRASKPENFTEEKEVKFTESFSSLAKDLNYLSGLEEPEPIEEILDILKEDKKKDKKRKSSKPDDEWLTLSDENVENIWVDIAKAMPDYVDAKSFVKARPKRPFATVFMKNKVNQDLLRLSGVIGEGEVLEDDDFEQDDHVDRFLKLLAKDMPKNMKLDLTGDILRINGIPTKISVQNIEAALEGLFELTGGVDDSLQAVVNVIRNKLKQLF